MKFKIQTKGHYDFIDITRQVASIVEQSKVEDGIVVVFVPGSTAAITTMEFESGIMEDLKQVFEGWAPEDADYKHHRRWGDHNGAAHIKSALIGPSLSVPIEEGALVTGTWQQIVLIDFDERPRTREIAVKVVST
ncbi:MAG TPA: secondary thiamine-phosphate synthase enzyme YjbQ [Blastocatellia bacterium]|nr:secondary thiamine-phosphate synthase enzyme YjbQ [Blastocatellia bacterium]